jgi:hypothetical protein
MQVHKSELEIGGPYYRVNMESIISALQSKIVHNIAVERYGVAAGKDSFCFDQYDSSIVISSVSGVDRQDRGSFDEQKQFRSPNDQRHDHCSSKGNSRKTLSTAQVRHFQPFGICNVLRLSHAETNGSIAMKSAKGPISIPLPLIISGNWTRLRWLEQYWIICMWPCST